MRHESGLKSDRPALKQLMDAARRREIDVICVWKFNRDEVRELHAQGMAICQQLGLSKGTVSGLCPA